MVDPSPQYVTAGVVLSTDSFSSASGCAVLLPVILSGARLGRLCPLLDQPVKWASPHGSREGRKVWVAGGEGIDRHPTPQTRSLSNSPLRRALAQEVTGPGYVRQSEAARDSQSRSPVRRRGRGGNHLSERR
ncbi:hypothetical protein MRX96_010727 [Rhipicephalus microplus]